MDIIVVSDGDYDRYEALVLKKEQLLKEADLIKLAYTREFGEKLTRLFELKIECIKLKKQIAYCVAHLNRGETIDMEDMQIAVEIQMSFYNSELRDMLSELDRSRETGMVLSDYEVEKIKKIYRKIAKLLHPDMSPLIEKIPQLGDMFNEAVNAYRSNDLAKLQEIEVMINKILKDSGLEYSRIVIPDIDERIEALENEIYDITNTEPYIFRELIEDKEKKREKHAELDADISETEAYRKELEEQYTMIVIGEI